MVPCVYTHRCLCLAPEALLCPQGPNIHHSSATQVIIQVFNASPVNIRVFCMRLVTPYCIDTWVPEG